MSKSVHIRFSTSPIGEKWTWRVEDIMVVEDNEVRSMQYGEWTQEDAEFFSNYVENRVTSNFKQLAKKENKHQELMKNKWGVNTGETFVHRILPPLNDRGRST